MKVIGLTGGIGTGKSTVSRYVKEKGYALIDADQIAREVTAPGTKTLFHLAQRFGAEILETDGSLNRRRLAQLAFRTPEDKAALDEITHSAILDCIDERLEALKKRFAKTPGAVVFLDAPLLLETGLNQKTDMVWVMDVPDELRICRIEQRDGWTREEILSRINRQMPREERLAQADWILDNSGTVEELYRQVEQLLSRLGGEER